MFAVSSTVRDRLFAAGIVCLIYGFGMLIADFPRLRRQHPPTLSPNIVAITPQSGSLNGPSWATPVRRKRGESPAVTKEAPPKAQPSESQITSVPAKAQWFRIDSGAVVRTSGNLVLSPIAMTTDGTGTKVRLLADASNSIHGRVCQFGPTGPIYGQESLFLLDDAGNRYHFRADLNRYPGTNCLDFASGERQALDYVFDTVGSQAHGLVMVWNGPDSTGGHSSQRVPFTLETSSGPEPTIASAGAVKMVVRSTGTVALPVIDASVSVESIEVGRTGTRIQFRATGPTRHGHPLCSVTRGLFGGGEKNFIIDDRGKRYDFLLSLREVNCLDIAQGEVAHFAFVYQPVELPISQLRVQFFAGGSSVVTIPVEVGR